MIQGFQPPAISICISRPARTQNMPHAANTARQSASHYHTNIYSRESSATQYYIAIYYTVYMLYILYTAPAITIQIYTLGSLRPLNSIPGADPLLFSLDYARPEPPAAENTNTHLKSGRSHCFGFTCLRKQACRQLWTTVDSLIAAFHLTAFLGFKA